MPADEFRFGRESKALPPFQPHEQKNTRVVKQNDEGHAVQSVLLRLKVQHVMKEEYIAPVEEEAFDNLRAQRRGKRRIWKVFSEHARHVWHQGP